MKLLFRRFRITRFALLICVFIILVLLIAIHNQRENQQYSIEGANQNTNKEHSEANVDVMDIKLDMKSDRIEIPEEPHITYSAVSSAPRLSSRDEEDGVLTILLWNPFFSNEDYYFGIGHQPFVDSECKVQACRTTRDHSYLDAATAVVIHGPRVDEPLPPYRPKGQLYAYVQAEPHYNGSKTYLPTMGDMFNITITNRRDSDIYIPYGMVVRSRHASKGQENVFVSPLNKPKDVVWAVSHCNTPGRRERYVIELRKHIQVDIYGACGTLVCPKTNECMEMFASEYKFYLALENHYCKDYVTEKLYKTLEYDIIPIVFGGADYTKDAPPHSVINILDYPNPKDLADYLIYLSKNVTAYNEYFEWKKNYYIEHFRHIIYGGVFCRLCEILHDSDYTYRNYTDIYSWWVDGMCDPNVIGRMARKYNWFVENLRFP